MTDPHPLALFRRYPGLADRVPWCGLGRWPTPLESVDHAAIAGGCRQLTVKRDDLSGEVYGGNKVRKLEFLLAEALARECRGVITFGAAGSNHALATSIYARALGLDSYSVLTRQAVTSAARRNLLTGHHVGARLMGFDSEAEAGAAAQRLLRASGDELMLIPGGGSSASGCLGFVSAALELADQLEAQGREAPDLIYLPLGTTGTVVGLQLGLRLAGLSSRVVAVRVVREDVADPGRQRRLYQGAAALLAPDVPGVGELPPVNESLEIRHEFYGPGYARYTPEGMAACARARDMAGIGLEGTYSGKAFAALLADLDGGRLTGMNVLFWNTYSSRKLPVPTTDYRDLPEFFHAFFERDLQPLDPESQAARGEPS